MTRETWPAMLRRLAELIGDELTLRLAESQGGIDGLYIPKRPTKSHPWARVVGPEAWRAIVAEYGGERVKLPRGSFVRLKKVVILELADQGLSRREIARRAQVSETYVRQTLGTIACDPAQTTLSFDET